ncbi:uncharacterized protein JCM10292_007197 [Rhodotorula paludigena]|uniref:uncharacterized protein n=1 Tax=Rhodotorula paludigena TaxID=86838 RepID=UPI0031808DB7
MASPDPDWAEGAAPLLSLRPAPRSLSPETKSLLSHFVKPERERFFWSDYKTKEEIKSVQALRPNEEVLSPGEGLRHIENLKRLVGSDAAAQDALHALSWSFDSSLRNHTYQLGLRDATYASTYLLQHNPRDVVFQHFVGCFVTLGQVLYQIELFMWASGGYVRSFPDPEPYLPKIRKDDCAPGTYVKVGSTTEAFGKNTIRDPFVVRSKRGISKTTSLVDPNGPDAEPLVFRRAEEDETTIEMARRLRYVGQGVGEEGMGGRGKGHLRPSFSGKDATGEPRVGTASLAFLGDPSQPVGKKRKLAAEHDVRMFAMTAIPRSRGNGFAQVVEQAGIEAAASCSSPYRLQEAVDCGMQFFACGGGGGLGTNMISSYAKGRTNDGPGMKLARFMKLLSEGLPVVLADFTDHSTGQRRRFAFPAVWESKAPHGMPRFGFLVNDLEAEGITSANPLRVWMRREGGTWTTVFGAFADDDSLGGDDVIKEWDAPHYSPEVMALACRFFAAKAIVGAAAFATEHNKEFERSASSLEALGVTTQDVDDATATVEKGLPKGGASGKRALSDRRAAADDSVRLIYGGEGSSGDIAFLRKPLMNDKGRPIAPALGFTVYKASFGGEFDREEIVAAFTSPTAVRVGLDDWELHFESSPLVIPLNNENVKIKTAAKNKITFATLETHFQAIRSGSAS